jgi:hypothetical protein
MTVTVSTKREFIPEFNGNRKLSATEQLRITHRAPTVAIKEKLFPRKFSFGANGEVTGTFEVDRKRIISELTIDFINFEYESDDEKKKITTVEQLFKAPVEFDPLIEELYTYYNTILNARPNEKN